MIRIDNSLIRNIISSAQQQKFIGLVNAILSTHSVTSKILIMDETSMKKIDCLEGFIDDV